MSQKVSIEKVPAGETLRLHVLQQVAPAAPSLPTPAFFAPRLAADLTEDAVKRSREAACEVLASELELEEQQQQQQQQQQQSEDVQHLHLPREDQDQEETTEEAEYEENYDNEHEDEEDHYHEPQDYRQDMRAIQAHNQGFQPDYWSGHVGGTGYPRGEFEEYLADLEEWRDWKRFAKAKSVSNPSKPVSVTGPPPGSFHLATQLHTPNIRVPAPFYPPGQHDFSSNRNMNQTSSSFTIGSNYTNPASAMACAADSFGYDDNNNNNYYFYNSNYSYSDGLSQQTYPCVVSDINSHSMQGWSQVHNGHDGCGYACEEMEYNYSCGMEPRLLGGSATATAAAANFVQQGRVSDGEYNWMTPGTMGDPKDYYYSTSTRYAAPRVCSVQRNNHSTDSPATNPPPHPPSFPQKASKQVVKAAGSKQLAAPHPCATSTESTGSNINSNSSSSTSSGCTSSSNSNSNSNSSNMSFERTTHQVPQQDSTSSKASKKASKSSKKKNASSDEDAAQVAQVAQLEVKAGAPAGKDEEEQSPESGEHIPMPTFQGWSPKVSMPAGPASPTSLPSIGSAKHGNKECKPCAFIYKEEGCKTGYDCEFCHLCPPMEKRRRKQVKQAKKKFAQRRAEKAAIAALESELSTGVVVEQEAESGVSVLS